MQASNDGRPRAARRLRRRSSVSSPRTRKAPCEWCCVDHLVPDRDRQLVSRRALPGHRDDLQPVGITEIEHLPVEVEAQRDPAVGQALEVLRRGQFEVAAARDRDRELAGAAEAGDERLHAGPAQVPRRGRAARGSRLPEELREALPRLGVVDAARRLDLDRRRQRRGVDLTVRRVLHPGREAQGRGGGTLDGGRRGDLERSGARLRGRRRRRGRLAGRLRLDRRPAVPAHVATPRRRRSPKNSATACSGPRPARDSLPARLDHPDEAVALVDRGDHVQVRLGHPVDDQRLPVGVEAAQGRVQVDELLPGRAARSRSRWRRRDWGRGRRRCRRGRCASERRVRSGCRSGPTARPAG